MTTDERENSLRFDTAPYVRPRVYEYVRPRMRTYGAV
jgi:hypothetical protein